MLKNEVETEMWRVIRILKNFTVLELSIIARGSEAYVPEETAGKYLEILAENGYVIKTGHWYKLLKNYGPLAPFVNHNGEFIDPNIDINIYKTDRQRIWESIRGLKKFNFTNLLASANISSFDRAKQESAKKYIDLLVRAGYLKEFIGNIYELIIDSGSLSPTIADQRKNKRLFDPNLKEYVNFLSQKEQLTENKRLIREVIENQKEFTVEDILNHTELKRESIKTVIKRLIDKNIIKKVGIRQKDKTRIAVYSLIPKKKPTKNPL